jgi:hypothetical protein
MPTPPPATAAEQDWGRITGAEQGDLMDRETSVSLFGVAARGAEVVAVGTIAGRGPAAWFSADGITWSRASSMPSTGAGVLSDVIATAQGYVAVGSNDDGAIAWRTADGRNWTGATVEAADGAILRRIAQGSRGMVALGGYENGGIEDIAVWTSADGSSWMQVAPAPALPSRTQPWSIAIGPALDVMIGAAFEDGVGWHASAWSSMDDKAWSEVPAFDRAENLAGIRDAIYWQSGFVAVGGSTAGASTGTAGPAVWLSPDGIEWQAVGGVPGAINNRDVILEAVASGGRGLVAVGGNAKGTVGVWTSTDGRDWIEIPSVNGLDSPIETYGTYQPADVVAGGPGLVAVGSYPNSDVGHTWSGAVWTSPAVETGAVPPTASPGCPADTKVKAIDVIALTPVQRLACFGDAELVFKAIVRHGEGDLVLGRPAWLMGVPAVHIEAILDGAGMDGRVNPAGSFDAENYDWPFSSADSWFIVTGHFDDDEAGQCQSSELENAVEFCREQFVVTAVEPTSRL